LASSSWSETLLLELRNSWKPRLLLLLLRRGRRGLASERVEAVGELVEAIEKRLEKRSFKYLLKLLSLKLGRRMMFDSVRPCPDGGRCCF